MIFFFLFFLFVTSSLAIHIDFVDTIKRDPSMNVKICIALHQSVFDFNETYSEFVCQAIDCRVYTDGILLRASKLELPYLLPSNANDPSVRLDMATKLKDNGFMVLDESSITLIFEEKEYKAIIFSVMIVLTLLTIIISFFSLYRMKT